MNHQRTFWRLPGEIFIAVLSISGMSSTIGAETASVVRLAVDFGDGVEKHFTAIPWHEGMTVLDALRFAERHRRGIELRTRGDGSSTFVTAIDGLENGDVAGHHWILRVNDKLGQRGCGALVLKSDDKVLWKFEPAP